LVVRLLSASSLALTTHAARFGRFIGALAHVAFIGPLAAFLPSVRGTLPVLVALVIWHLAAFLSALLGVGATPRVTGDIAPRWLPTGLALVAAGAASLIRAPVLIVSHDRLPHVEHRMLCVQL